MMQERNILNGAFTVILSEFLNGLYPLRWMCVLVLALVILDLRVGIGAAKKRGEKIRISRAGRRTINKLMDYSCWLLFAVALGKAVGEPLSIPLLPLVAMLFALGFEIDSVINNWCEIKGKKYKFSLLKWLKKKNDVFDIIEENENKKEK
ncbi:MAG: phage holin family protein [Bacteroidales bacterium]